MVTITIDRFDLFAIIVSGVIVGGFFLAMSIAAAIRYSRHEKEGDTNYSKELPDISAVLITIGLCGYGLWRAGIFGPVG